MRSVYMIFITLLLFVTQSFANTGSGNVTNVANGGGAITSSNGPSISMPLNSISTATRGSIAAYAQTASDYFSFFPLGTFGQNPNGQAYKVSVGKTCYCLGASILADTASGYLLGYGTTSVTASASGPAGEVDYAPTTTTYNLWTAIAQIYVDLFVTFPTGTIPFMKQSATVANQRIKLDCIEQ